jgi:hypothetical protein
MKNPGLGRKSKNLQGGSTNGTAIWQKEKPYPEGEQEEEAGAHPAQADTDRKVGRCRQK